MLAHKDEKNETSACLTHLLLEYSKGSEEALNQLLPLVHGELRRLAHSYLRKERANHTLQPTALVNEAFLRLIPQTIQWESRSHFFAVAALAMRQVLVTYARQHRAEKRGGGKLNIVFDDRLESAKGADKDLLALDDALTTLAKENPRQSQIVELKYFGGLSIEETAKVLGISGRTVKRDWVAAKAWLYRQMREGVNAGS